MLNSRKDITVLGIKINNIDYEEMGFLIREALANDIQIAVTGVNVSTINLSIDQPGFLNILNSFEILHPDGIGLYLYSKFSKKKNQINKRITGSDFYSFFIKEIIKMKWKIFFFGDEISTLNKIMKKNPNLEVVGLQNGFDYESEKVISNINNSRADILIVGMGAPKQEEWIYKYRKKLNAKVIIAVGDGIKMFTGTKIRGYKIIQNLGFEWLVRLLHNPLLYWKRYLVGIPIFIIRAIKEKGKY